jgi:hypothetical protein
VAVKHWNVVVRFHHNRFVWAEKSVFFTVGEEKSVLVEKFGQKSMMARLAMSFFRL